MFLFFIFLSIDSHRFLLNYCCGFLETIRSDHSHRNFWFVSLFCIEMSYLRQDKSLNQHKQTPIIVIFPLKLFKWFVRPPVPHPNSNLEDLFCFQSISLRHSQLLQMLATFLLSLESTLVIKDLSHRADPIWKFSSRLILLNKDFCSRWIPLLLPQDPLPSVAL